MAIEIIMDAAHIKLARLITDLQLLLYKVNKLPKQIEEAANAVVVLPSTSTNTDGQKCLCSTCRLRASGCGLVYKENCESYIIGGIA